MKRRLFINCFAVLLVFALSSPVWAGGIKAGNNQPLPDVSWEDIDGNTHRLSDSNGKPRILHFWAAWCVPCRKEMPEMLQWKALNSDIVVLPLSMDQRMAQSKHFIKKYKLDMSPWLLNKDSSEELKVPVLPYTIFVSADGKEVGHFAGIAAWESDEFTAKVRKVLAVDALGSDPTN